MVCWFDSLFDCLIGWFVCPFVRLIGRVLLVLVVVTPVAEYRKSRESQRCIPKGCVLYVASMSFFGGPATVVLLR